MIQGRGRCCIRGQRDEYIVGLITATRVSSGPPRPSPGGGWPRWGTGRRVQCGVAAATTSRLRTSRLSQPGSRTDSYRPRRPSPGYPPPSSARPPRGAGAQAIMATTKNRWSSCQRRELDSVREISSRTKGLLISVPLLLALGLPPRYPAVVALAVAPLLLVAVGLFMVGMRPGGNLRRAVEPSQLTRGETATAMITSINNRVTPTGVVEGARPDRRTASTSSPVAPRRQQP